MSRLASQASIRSWSSPSSNNPKGIAKITEIAKKGAASRFRRAEVKTTEGDKTIVERGYFELTDAGKAADKK